MTYEYECQCGNSFDVIKPMARRDDDERCACGETANRVMFPRKTHLSGTSVENAEYNPGLGCVVKNKYHRQELCKQKGVTEVGNDYGGGEAMQTKFDKAREEKRERSWNEVNPHDIV